MNHIVVLVLVFYLNFMVTVLIYVSTKGVWWLSFSPHPCYHWTILCLSENSHSNRCDVLICISLKISDVEPFKVSLSLSSFEKHLFKSFFWEPFIQTQFLSCLNTYIFYILNPITYVDCQYFLPICRLSLCSVNCFLCYTEAFSFDVISLSLFLLSAFCQI